MSIFGQVWLWSLAAFLLGALLTWILLVRPAQARVRELERKLTTTRSERVAQDSGSGASAEHKVPFTADDYAAGHGAVEYGIGDEPAAFSEPDGQRLAGLVHQEIDDDFDAFGTATDGNSDGMWEPSHDYATDFSATGEQHDGYTELFEPAQQEHEDHGVDPDESTRIDLGPSIGAALDPASDEHEPVDFEYPEPANSRGLFQPALPTTGGPYYEDEFEEFGPQDDYTAEVTPLERATEVTEVAEPPERTDGLPKRQPRESPPGGFDPPAPIQPSMRTVTRREPEQDDGGYSGSLFEPSVPSAATEPAPEAGVSPAPSASEQDGPEDSGVPVGPFGPGSAMPLPGGAKPAEDFEIKASVTTLRYCSPGSPRFDDMVAEVWFRGEADAERVGFRSID